MPKQSGCGPCSRPEDAAHHGGMSEEATTPAPVVIRPDSHGPVSFVALQKRREVDWIDPVVEVRETPEAWVLPTPYAEYRVERVTGHDLRAARRRGPRRRRPPRQEGSVMSDVVSARGPLRRVRDRLFPEQHDFYLNHTYTTHHEGCTVTRRPREQVCLLAVGIPLLLTSSSPASSPEAGPDSPSGPPRRLLWEWVCTGEERFVTLLPEIDATGRAADDLPLDLRLPVHAALEELIDDPPLTAAGVGVAERLLTEQRRACKLKADRLTDRSLLRSHDEQSLKRLARDETLRLGDTFARIEDLDS